MTSSNFIGRASPIPIFDERDGTNKVIQPRIYHSSHSAERPKGVGIDAPFPASVMFKGVRYYKRLKPETESKGHCRHCGDGLGSYNCFCTGRS